MRQRLAALFDSLRGAWVQKGAWTVLDQALFAGANFAVNVALARWLDPAGYGAYTVAFTVFLLLGTVHAGYLVEPMLVFGAGRFRERLGAYLRVLLAGHGRLALAFGAVLGAAAAGAWAVGERTLALALAAFALGQGAVLFQWAMRSACYVRTQPRLAAAAGAAVRDARARRAGRARSDRGPRRAGGRRARVRRQPGSGGCYCSPPGRAAPARGRRRPGARGGPRAPGLRRMGGLDRRARVVPRVPPVPPAPGVVRAGRGRRAPGAVQPGPPGPPRVPGPYRGCSCPSSCGRGRGARAGGWRSASGPGSSPRRRPTPWRCGRSGRPCSTSSTTDSTTPGPGSCGLSRSCRSGWRSRTWPRRCSGRPSGPRPCSRRGRRPRPWRRRPGRRSWPRSAWPGRSWPRGRRRSWRRP